MAHRRASHRTHYLQVTPAGSIRTPTTRICGLLPRPGGMSCPASIPQYSVFVCPARLHLNYSQLIPAAFNKTAGWGPQQASSAIAPGRGLLDQHRPPEALSSIVPNTLCKSAWNERACLRLPADCSCLCITLLDRARVSTIFSSFAEH